MKALRQKRRRRKEETISLLGEAPVDVDHSSGPRVHLVSMIDLRTGESRELGELGEPGESRDLADFLNLVPSSLIVQRGALHLHCCEMPSIKDPSVAYSIEFWRSTSRMLSAKILGLQHRFAVTERRFHAFLVNSLETFANAEVPGGAHSS